MTDLPASSVLKRGWGKGEKTEKSKEKKKGNVTTAAMPPQNLRKRRESKEEVWRKRETRRERKRETAGLVNYCASLDYLSANPPGNLLILHVYLGLSSILF